MGGPRLSIDEWLLTRLQVYWCSALCLRLPSLLLCGLDPQSLRSGIHIYYNYVTLAVSRLDWTVFVCVGGGEGRDVCV